MVNQLRETKRDPGRMNRTMSDQTQKDTVREKTKKIHRTKPLGNGVRDPWLQSVLMAYLLHFFGKLV